MQLVLHPLMLHLLKLDLNIPLLNWTVESTIKLEMDWLS